MARLVEYSVDFDTQELVLEFDEAVEAISTRYFIAQSAASFVGNEIRSFNVDLPYNINPLETNVVRVSLAYSQELINVLSSSLVWKTAASTYLSIFSPQGVTFRSLNPFQSIPQTNARLADAFQPRTLAPTIRRWSYTTGRLRIDWLVPIYRDLINTLGFSVSGYTLSDSRVEESGVGYTSTIILGAADTEQLKTGAGIVYPRRLTLLPDTVRDQFNLTNLGFSVEEIDQHRQYQGNSIVNVSGITPNPDNAFDFGRSNVINYGNSGDALTSFGSNLQVDWVSPGNGINSLFTTDPKITIDPPSGQGEVTVGAERSGTDWDCPSGMTTGSFFMANADPSVGTIREGQNFGFPRNTQLWRSWNNRHQGAVSFFPYSQARNDSGDTLMVGSKEDRGYIYVTDNADYQWRQIGDTERFPAFRSVCYSSATGTWIAVGLSGAIYRSQGGFDNWQPIVSPTRLNLYSVAFGTILSGTEYFVAVGQLGTVVVSTDDGVTWQRRVSGITDDLNSVVISDNTITAVGGSSVLSRILTSSDAVTFTLDSSISYNFPFYSISRFNDAVGYIVVGGSDGFASLIITKQAADVGWTQRLYNTTTQRSALRTVTWNQDEQETYVAAGNNGLVYFSEDAITWFLRSIGTTGNVVSSGIVGPERDVLNLALQGRSGELGYYDSRIGASWSNVDSVLSSATDISYIGQLVDNRWVVSSSSTSNCLIYSDSNGRSWQAATLPIRGPINQLAAGDGRIIAVGGNSVVDSIENRLLISTDGVNWQQGDANAAPRGLLASYGDGTVTGWVMINDNYTRYFIDPSLSVEQQSWSNGFGANLQWPVSFDANIFLPRAGEIFTVAGAANPSFNNRYFTVVSYDAAAVPNPLLYTYIAQSGLGWTSGGNPYLIFEKQVQFSNDLVTWTRGRIPLFGSIVSLAYGNNVWVAIAFPNNTNQRIINTIWYSYNGLDWFNTQAAVSGQAIYYSGYAGSNCVGVRFVEGRFWLLTDYPLYRGVVPDYSSTPYYGEMVPRRFTTSLDGVNWSEWESTLIPGQISIPQNSGILRDINYTQGLWTVEMEGVGVFISNDFFDWNQISISSTIGKVQFNNKTGIDRVGVKQRTSSAIWTDMSTLGISYNYRPLTSRSNLVDFAYDGNTYLFVGNRSSMMTTTDLYHFTEFTGDLSNTSPNLQINSVTWFNETANATNRRFLVTVQGNGQVFNSLDQAATWTAAANGPERKFDGINLEFVEGHSNTVSGNILLAGGAQDSLFVSYDGDNWQTIANSYRRNYPQVFQNPVVVPARSRLSVAGGKYWATGIQGDISWSYNGTVWCNVAVAGNSSAEILSIAFQESTGNFYAYGNQAPFVSVDGGFNWTPVSSSNGFGPLPQDVNWVRISSDVEGFSYPDRFGITRSLGAFAFGYQNDDKTQPLLYRTLDARAFSQVSLPVTSETINSVRYYGGNIWAVGTNGFVASSRDIGQTWTTWDTGQTYDWLDVLESHAPSSFESRNPSLANYNVRVIAAPTIIYALNLGYVSDGWYPLDAYVQRTNGALTPIPVSLSGSWHTISPGTASGGFQTGIPFDVDSGAGARRGTYVNGRPLNGCWADPLRSVTRLYLSDQQDPFSGYTGAFVLEDNGIWYVSFEGQYYNLVQYKFYGEIRYSNNQPLGSSLNLGWQTAINGDWLASGRSYIFSHTGGHTASWGRNGTLNTLTASLRPNMVYGGVNSQLANLVINEASYVYPGALDGFGFTRSYSHGTALLAGDGFILATTDGVNFANLSTPTVHSSVTVNNRITVVGNEGYIAYTDDGINYTQVVSGTNNSIQDIAYGNGLYVASGVNSTLLVSNDGIVWDAVNQNLPTGVLFDMNWANGVYISVGSAASLAISTDGGTIWSGRRTGVTSDLTAVGNIGARHVIGGVDSIVLSTTDFIDYQTANVPNAAGSILSYVALGNITAIGPNPNVTLGGNLFTWSVVIDASSTLVNATTNINDILVDNSPDANTRTFATIISATAIPGTVNGYDLTLVQNDGEITANNIYNDDETQIVGPRELHEFSAISSSHPNRVLLGTTTGRMFSSQDAVSLEEIGTLPSGQVNSIYFDQVEDRWYVSVGTRLYSSANSIINWRQELSTISAYNSVLSSTANSSIILNLMDDRRSLFGSLPNTNSLFARYTFANSMSGIAFDETGSIAVAVGAQGEIQRSRDTQTWLRVDQGMAGNSQLNVVRWAKNRFIAVGANGTIASSGDGIAWANSRGNIQDLTSSVTDVYWDETNDVFVACTQAGNIIASIDDGTTWRYQSNTGVALKSITSTSSGNIAINANVVEYSTTGLKIYTSDDGITWTTRSYDSRSYVSSSSVQAFASRIFYDLDQDVLFFFYRATIYSYRSQMYMVMVSSRDQGVTWSQTSRLITSGPYYYPSNQFYYDQGAEIQGRWYIYLNSASSSIFWSLYSTVDWTDVDFNISSSYFFQPNQLGQVQRVNGNLYVYSDSQFRNGIVPGPTTQVVQRWIKTPSAGFWTGLNTSWQYSSSQFRPAKVFYLSDRWVTFSAENIYYRSTYRYYRYQSLDDGITWSGTSTSISLSYSYGYGGLQPSAGASDGNSAVFGSALWTSDTLQGGDFTRIQRYQASTVTWSIATSLSGQFRRVAYGDDGYFGVRSDEGAVLFSNDGRAWELSLYTRSDSSRASSYWPLVGYPQGIAYVPDSRHWVTADGGHVAAYSSDRINWTRGPQIPTGSAYDYYIYTWGQRISRVFYDIAAGRGQDVAFMGKWLLYTYFNSSNYQGILDLGDAVSYDGGRSIGFYQDRTSYSFTRSQSINGQTQLIKDRYNLITYNGLDYYQGQVLSSIDLYRMISAMTRIGNRWFAATREGYYYWYCYYSDDGITWSGRTEIARQSGRITSIRGDRVTFPLGFAGADINNIEGNTLIIAGTSRELTTVIGSQSYSISNTLSDLTTVDIQKGPVANIRRIRYIDNQYIAVGDVSTITVSGTDSLPLTAQPSYLDCSANVPAGDYRFLGSTGNNSSSGFWIKVD